MDIAPPDPIVNDPASAEVEIADDGEPTLAEHEAAFHAKRSDSRAPDPSAAAAGTAPAPGAEGLPADADARDDKGRFKRGQRHRAASQQATPADAPRIAELTRKLREAQTELEAVRKPAAQVAPPAALSVPRGTQPPTAAAKPTLKQFVDALTETEPYELALERHADALSDWKLEQYTAKQAEQAAEREFMGGFKSRVEAAKAKYPDFQAVALDAPTKIPVGSLVDRWIMEHKAGPDVLYHFQTDETDLSRVLALPILDQAEALALLAHGFSTPVAPAPAAPRPVVAAPRPPNPTRTAPSKPTEEIGDDLSLAEHEKHFGQRRRT